MIPPDNLMWVGGTVIPMLETTKELWINRARWIGIWDPLEAKEERKSRLTEKANPEEIAEMCRKWRKDRPLEGGVRHIREKASFIW